MGVTFKMTPFTKFLSKTDAKWRQCKGKNPFFFSLLAASFCCNYLAAHVLTEILPQSKRLQGFPTWEKQYKALGGTGDNQDFEMHERSAPTANKRHH